MPAQVHVYYLHMYTYKTCSTEALITIRVKIILPGIRNSPTPCTYMYMYMYNVHTVRLDTTELYLKRTLESSHIHHCTPMPGHPNDVDKEGHPLCWPHPLSAHCHGDSSWLTWCSRSCGQCPTLVEGGSEERRKEMKTTTMATALARSEWGLQHSIPGADPCDSDGHQLEKST